MKSLYRSSRNKKLGGVCGGIAEQMGWDVSTVRFMTVAAIIIFNPLFFVYMAAWILLPEK